jgi:hypothetical protein
MERGMAQGNQKRYVKSVFASEAGWQQGFDLLPAAWEKTTVF